MKGEATGMEAYWLAGHRTDRRHDCFVMNCSGLMPEIEALRRALIRARRIEDAVRELWPTLETYADDIDLTDLIAVLFPNQPLGSVSADSGTSMSLDAEEAMGPVWESVRAQRP